MKIIQNLITQGKYGIKCPYEMTPKGICIHNTANDASAKNEIAYMHNNNNEVSFHIAVDDVEAIQGLPLNRNAWHAGDGGSGEGNRNYIAIEICYSKSGGDRFIKAEKNCAVLVAQMLKERGWGLDKIKKHQNFSNKYCPHRTLDMGWQRFLNMVQSELNTLNKPTQSTSGEMYRVRKTWSDVASQIGAFSNLENAKKSCISGYSVFDSKGNKVYPPTTTTTPSTPSGDINVGSKVRIIGSKYATGETIPSWVSANVYTVQQISNGKALIKEIVSWVYVKDLVLASANVITPQPSTPTKIYLNLKPHVASWRVYKTNVAPRLGNECGALSPKNYGGLSYQILGNPQTDVYTIQTSSFGKVNIYAPRDNDSTITNSPIY